LSSTRIGRALNAVPDPVTGLPVCQSVVDGSDPSCVPWNVFETGAVTQEMIDYLVLPLYAKGQVNQKQLNAYVSADLGDYGWSVPSAAEGVKVAFGTEYRKEESVYEPDNGYSTGDGAGQGGAQQYTAGQFDVTELFMEASIPLLSDMAFAQDVTVDVGYRYSDYSTDQTTDTYKLAGNWVLNNQIRFRGSYQKAVRAANINELFSPQGYNLFDMTIDPCAGAVPEATLAECANSGVTAAQYGSIPASPANQYNYIQGGNPDLTPEDSDTYSFGGQWTPGFAEGLVLSVDYWSIEVKDAISTVDPAFILDQCIYEGTQQFCDLVNRAPTNGNLWIGDANVTSTYINIAGFKTDGFDLQADYTMSVGDMGTLNFSYVATLLNAWDETPIPGAEVIECAGYWGGSCGSPSPEYRANFRATWTTNWNATITGAWRYTGEVKDLDGNVNLDAVNYFDLAGLWDFYEGMTLRVGVNNILDEDPPVAGGGAGPSNYGNGNTFPGVYDALGRYVFAGVTVKF
jgi:outer membrane receptor protein involved in Fe transport